MTSYVVIDAGLAFKLLVPNPQRDRLKTLVRQWSVQQRALYGPALWLYELTSIFTKSVYLGVMSEEEAQAGLLLAMQLQIQLLQPDEEQGRRAFAWTRRLGRVAAYDSFYLAVAEILGCEFWTVDQRLAHAANQSWVKLAGIDAPP